MKGSGARVSNLRDQYHPVRFTTQFCRDHEWDGDIDNTFLNQPVNFRENENFRARLVWRPTDRLEIDMFGNYDDLYGGTYHFSTIVDQEGRAILEMLLIRTTTPFKQSR